MSYSDHNLSDVRCPSSSSLLSLLLTFTFSSLSPEPLSQFQANLAQSVLAIKAIQIPSNEGPRSFQRGDNYESAKIHWQIFKMFFSRTNGPVSTKLSTNHPCVEGSQVCSNEGPRPFPKGDNYEIAKIHWQIFKIFFSRTSGQISTELSTKRSWVKGFKFVQKKDLDLCQGEIISEIMYN